MSGLEGVKPIMRVRELARAYTMGEAQVLALKGVSLDILPGEMTAIIGRSGSGKTTMLNLMAGLDRPTSGEVWFRDQRIDLLNERDLLKLRQDHFGFVFQSFGLLPLLSAAENIGIPLRVRQFTRAEREQRVQEALEWVGLTKRSKHRPYEMSGGEQQRVGLARALASQPELILADEPTGQLDSKIGRQIISLLRRIVQERGMTVVVITHDPQTIAEADTIYELRDGALFDSQQ
ncbi:MAG: ABC transporter ATP-binding protein [Anaerolineae bacterium]|nr:ABC transporter ATP-binding protein [Anaerolineae bacterium]NUQ07047.1 ABC transporter ATP-binding protein [Anaerolineae bacterium]